MNSTNFMFSHKIHTRKHRLREFHGKTEKIQVYFIFKITNQLTALLDFTNRHQCMREHHADVFFVVPSVPDGTKNNDESKAQAPLLKHYIYIYIYIKFIDEI